LSMGNGLTVELGIEDRRLADRVAAMLHALDVDLVEPNCDAALIAITDVLPQVEPDQAVILLADDVDPVAALRAGVAGVLPKSAELADLRIALDAAGRGLAVAPLRLIGQAHWDALERHDGVDAADSIGLTARELEVLALLGEGASNKEIARRLAISVHTAKFHVASILDKLDATGRTDAVAHAIRLGLLML
jgi:DNA-binding NarL/FixJ family response regulator